MLTGSNVNMSRLFSGFPCYKGISDQFMNEHLASKISGFCVACMDAGEGREQGCGSFENLTNCWLFAAIIALYLVV